MNILDELPPGRYGHCTIYEPVRPTNPPAGSENWPVVEMQVVNRFTMYDAVGPDAPPLDPAVAGWTERIAERIAAMPESDRAELMHRVGLELERAVARITAVPNK